MKRFKRITRAPLAFAFIAAVAMVPITFVLPGNAAENMESGKKIYLRNCLECHHKDGMGILAPPFVESTRFKSRDGVVALIDYIMPATSPDLCTGDRAEDVSAYIVQEFKFQAPENTLDPESATDAAGRKALFDLTCSVCHGVDGKGDLARPIVRTTLFKTGKDCVKFIDGLMPFHNPRKCKGVCADNAARYIIDNFEPRLSDN